MNEHVRDDLDLYALGMLEPDERERVERHLASCATCRGELGAAEATVAALAAASSAPPPRDLRDAVVARHRPRRWLGLPRPLAAAALGFVALAAVALATVEQVVTLEPKGIGASATVIVARGGATFLVLAAPEPPAGKAYEAWVIRGGTAIPAGLAPAGRGLAVIAFDVALRPGDVAAVTVEQAAGAPAPTSEPVLVGSRGGS